MLHKHWNKVCCLQCRHSDGVVSALLGSVFHLLRHNTVVWVVPSSGSTSSSVRNLAGLRQLITQSTAVRRLQRRLSPSLSKTAAHLAPIRFDLRLSVHNKLEVEFQQHLITLPVRGNSWCLASTSHSYQVATLETATIFILILLSTSTLALIHFVFFRRVTNWNKIYTLFQLLKASSTLACWILSRLTQ